MRKQTDNGTVFCESVATYMESLLTGRDFAGAVEYYEANRSLVADVGGSWAGAMLHRVARAYASLTNYPAALKAARMAQAMTAKEGDSLLLAEIFVTLGRILRDSGELREAQKAFRDAESIFRRNDCLEGQSRALNHLAGTYFRQNDYRNALTVLMDAVGIAKKLNDNRKLAYMMGNVGRLQTFMGDFAQAENHLGINIELSTQLGDEIDIARARLSLGYIYLQQAEFSRATEEFEQAYLLIVALGARREEVIYLTYLGELLYKTGRFSESKKALQKALAAAEDISPGTTLAGRVMRHLAELHLRLENHPMAQKFAARSTVIMEKAGDQVELGALACIKAQLADARRQAAKARELFTRAIDMLDESGVRWEMAQVLVTAASSPLYSDRQRLTYLFRAEDFYARSGLTNQLQEVSRLMGGLGTFNEPVASEPAASPSTETIDYLTQCPEIRRFKKQLPMLGRADLPLLITGETGVGKDHLAKYFHSLVRPQGPLVAINCASVPDTLLESELFGYCRGAFTGADRDKTGLFVAANGGVVLLDEIGDMPLPLQAKLLGVLETRKVLPLGGTAEVDIDVILVATTNRDLESMVEQGSFRRDLFYRLSGMTFHLPPLRERKEDVPLLLEYFLGKYDLIGNGQKLPTALVRQFIDYHWPGNIRELANKVKRLEVMARMVSEGDLAEVARSVFSTEKTTDSENLFGRLAQFERQLITEALLAAGGNKSEAARLLGVHEATVRTKLKRYGIDRSHLAQADRDVTGGAPN